MSGEPAALNLASLSDSDFNALYNGRIKPHFDAHEPQRIEAVAGFRNRLWNAAPLVAVAALAAGVISQEVGFALIVVIGGGLIAFGYAWTRISQMQAVVKNAAIGAICEAVNIRFDPMLAMPPAFERFRALGLAPAFDRRSHEDHFSGAHHGADFDLYESHLEVKRKDSKGRTYWSTVFRGQMLRLSFPRNFLGVTIVRRDAGMFNAFNGASGLKKVGLEDPKFEKAFEVYGSDQVEARYLLHPVFMERLLTLEARFSGKRLRCAFEGGDLLVAIEGGNLFEPGSMFKPLADPARARKLVDEIGAVMALMDAVLTAQAARPK